MLGIQYIRLDAKIKTEDGKTVQDFVREGWSVASDNPSGSGGLIVRLERRATHDLESGPDPFGDLRNR
jgi:hypothetical protein